jgi:predicted nucleotidyltransferase
MDRKKNLRKIASRCAEFLGDKYKVKRVILIGSLVSGKVHKKSDIDLVVEGLAAEIYIKSLTELYDLLPAGVDINLIPFEDAFETLRQKALQRGEVIYG